jgi:hypothetical protein
MTRSAIASAPIRHHLTRLGIDEDGVALFGALETMLHDARHVPDVDVAVVSGDISDDGSVAGYPWRWSGSAASPQIGGSPTSVGRDRAGSRQAHAVMVKATPVRLHRAT